MWTYCGTFLVVIEVVFPGLVDMMHALGRKSLFYV